MDVHLQQIGAVQMMAWHCKPRHALYACICLKLCDWCLQSLGGQLKIAPFPLWRLEAAVSPGPHPALDESDAQPEPDTAAGDSKPAEEPGKAAEQQQQQQTSEAAGTEAEGAKTNDADKLAEETAAGNASPEVEMTEAGGADAQEGAEGSQTEAAQPSGMPEGELEGAAQATEGRDSQLGDEGANEAMEDEPEDEEGKAAELHADGEASQDAEAAAAGGLVEMVEGRRDPEVSHHISLRCGSHNLVFMWSVLDSVLLFGDSISVKPHSGSVAS